MLTAAIVTGDTASAAQLLASLEQTGLVNPAIKQWTVSSDKMPDAGEVVADIVLLDLGRDPEPFFIFGTHLRRMRPSARLIACSATNPPNPQLLLDAMRSGVQDFVAKPVTPAGLKEILARFTQEGHSTGRAADKLIVVMGSKGGVGTTTVAVNLGVQLCAHAQQARRAARFCAAAGKRASSARSASALWNSRRDRQSGPSRQSLFRGTSRAAQIETRDSGRRHAAGRVAKHPDRAAERVVNVAQAGFDSGSGGHGIALRLRFEPRAHYRADDSDGGGGECSFAVDPSAAAAGA